MKTRLVIVSSRFPYPLIKGDKLRLFHQIRFLAKEFSICLISISDVEITDEEKSHLSPFCDEIHVFRLAKWKSIANCSVSFKDNLPIQVSYFYSKKIHKEITDVIKSFDPKLAYFQLVRTALYASDLNIPAVLDYMDSFSTIAQRDASYSSILRKIVFSIEARRLRLFERKVLDWFEETTIISENDKAELLNPTIHVITNGVDVNYFKPTKHGSTYDICFIGNLGYSPNQRAVNFLTNKIIPKLKFKYPTLKVLIAGARPSQHILDLQNETIDVKADLKDIREAYSESKIFVAPIFTGAGQQNKILEAMAMGLPCVTSTVVNSSIGASPDQIKIGFSNTDFVNHSLSLLNDVELYAKQRQHALEFVKSQFSWDVQAQKLTSILHSVLKDS